MQPPTKSKINYNKILTKFNFLFVIYIFELNQRVRFFAFLNLLLGLVDWLRHKNRTPLPITLLILIIAPLLNKLTSKYALYCHLLALVSQSGKNILSTTSTLHYKHTDNLFTFTQLSTKYFCYKLLNYFESSSASDSFAFTFLSILSALVVVRSYVPQYTAHFLFINFFFYFVVDHIHDFCQQYKVRLTGSWDMKSPKLRSDHVS